MKSVKELDGTELQFEFPSSRSFVEYVRDLNETRKDLFFQESSHSTNDYHREFTNTNNFEHALELYEYIDATKDEKHNLDTLYQKMIRSTKLSEEGFEISVPDSMQETIWIAQSRKPAKKIIIGTLPIICSYCAGTEADDVIEAVKVFMLTCVENNIEIKNYSFEFPAMYEGDTEKTFNCKISAKQSDWDDFLKVTHPSFFRRLMFRLKEGYKHLPYGYGRPLDEVFEKGFGVQELVDMITVGDNNEGLKQYIIDKCVKISQLK